MNIKLLRSFGAMGYTIKIDRDGNVAGEDRNGNELIAGTDYIVEKADEKDEISIEQSNGLVAYVPKR